MMFDGTVVGVGLLVAIAFCVWVGNRDHARQIERSLLLRDGVKGTTRRPGGCSAKTDPRPTSAHARETGVACQRRPLNPKRL